MPVWDYFYKYELFVSLVQFDRVTAEPKFDSTESFPVYGNLFARLPNSPDLPERSTCRP